MLPLAIEIVHLQLEDFLAIICDLNDSLSPARHIILFQSILNCNSNLFFISNDLYIAILLRVIVGILSVVWVNALYIYISFLHMVLF